MNSVGINYGVVLTITETRSPNEITQQAIAVFFREIGTANIIGFFSQFSTGYGEYTEEQKNLLEDSTMEQFLAEMGSSELDQ
jgi:hypothetical protein